MPSCLDVRGYTKAYDTLVAVRDLSFHVDAGQILGLVGPNGAGKTTTMRAVAGIIQPTHGAITVLGHDIVAAPVEAKRRLAYVPDDPKLFDALTIWEHLRFIAAAYEVRAWEPAANALLDRFELAPKRDALAQELSRGMRQKLAICCASLHAPALLMLDEPMTGLDPRGIRTLKDAIREHATRGAGVVISSHLLALVEDLVTHLLIVHRGERIFLGSVDEARASFGAGGGSLEELFFKATETGAGGAEA
ncbi:MAG: ABC transporter ATP-binding protein [Phycisphaerales bacterium]|jgi:ABC-2 type transport system ATP-binding protein